MRDIFLNLLFPLRCPVCDDIVPLGEGRACFSCRSKIRYISETTCRKCGRQLNDGAKVFCADCEKMKHVFDRGAALYDYQSMKKSIFRFKYKGRCEYAKFFAEDLYIRFKEELQNMKADVIVPIPLHKSRKRARGYNQAELVAKHLSRLTGIPMQKNLVIRAKKTIPQKELDSHARQNNLKKAFHINPNVVKLSKRILLVDDIYTTGSTIDAVSYVLKRHGAETIYFVTLCIGESL